MFDRSCLKALLLIGIALSVAGCTSTQGLDSIQVSPSTQSVAVGQTVQLTATGTFGNASHLTTQDVTGAVTWSSNNTSVATVSSGVVTGVSTGTATITATAQGYNGTVTSSATVTVSTSGGPAGGTIVSLTVIPSSQVVATPSQTSQFIAIGTTSTGATVNVTNQVTWSSSVISVATIGANTGLAAGAGQGTTTITAIATNGNDTVATAEATFTVNAGASEPITSFTITPSSESLSAEGQTSQLIAVGTQGTTGLQENLTSLPQLTWVSSIPSVASISDTGLVTGLSVGVTTISAYWTNPDNSIVQATEPATITTTSTPPPEPLLSLSIIPSSLSVDDLQDTGNFLAIGTYSTAPYVRDLTNSVTWISSFPNVFPVTSDSTTVNPGAPGGIVTAYGDGSATIIAEATATDGSVQTQTAQFSCPFVEPCPCSNAEGCNPAVTSCPNGPVRGSCFPTSQTSGLLVTLTIYNEGLNTTNWLVTAPSATGTPDVIHCGPGWTLGGGTGGSVCTATYPTGTQVTLTATQPTATTGTFGGWSSSCTIPPSVINPDPSTAAGPNTCQITLGVDGNSNVTVGAIFN